MEQLEKDVWEEPTFDSHPVLTCHALRKEPVRDFSIENLRIMIGQNIGLKYLVPKALELLKGNPLAAGDFFEGDLLLNVLRSQAYEFLDQKYLDKKLIPVCEAALALDRDDLHDELRELVNGFLDKTVALKTSEN
ncbi:MAG: contact-dependent growth inhibition system immunity protein [Pseudomonadota bacterium]